MTTVQENSDMAEARLPDALTADESLPMETLNHAIEAIRERIASYEARIKELNRDLLQAREEERLLGRLLALRKGDTCADNEAPARTLNEEHHGSNGGSNGSDLLVGVVVESLRDSGKPVHISELMRVLRERGVTIPGAGTQANLITRIRRDSRLVRPSRGMYALSEWGFADMTVPKKKRRRRRSRRRRNET